MGDVQRHARQPREGASDDDSALVAAFVQLDRTGFALRAPRERNQAIQVVYEHARRVRVLGMTADVMAEAVQQLVLKWLVKGVPPAKDLWTPGIVRRYLKMSVHRACVSLVRTRAPKQTLEQEALVSAMPLERPGAHGRRLPAPPSADRPELTTSQQTEVERALGVQSIEMIRDVLLPLHLGQKRSATDLVESTFEVRVAIAFGAKTQQAIALEHVERDDPPPSDAKIAKRMDTQRKSQVRLLERLQQLVQARPELDPDGVMEAGLKFLSERRSAPGTGGTS